MQSSQPLCAFIGASNCTQLGHTLLHYFSNPASKLANLFTLFLFGVEVRVETGSRYIAQVTPQTCTLASTML
jgi:hypothetical protein